MLVLLGYAEDYGNRDFVSVKFSGALVKRPQKASLNYEEKFFTTIRKPVLPFGFQDSFNSVAKKPVVDTGSFTTQFYSFANYPDGYVGFNAIYTIRTPDSGVYVSRLVSLGVVKKEQIDFSVQRESNQVLGFPSVESKTSLPDSLDLSFDNTFTSFIQRDAVLSPIVTYRVFPLIKKKVSATFERQYHFLLGIAKNLNPSDYEPKKEYSYEIKCEIGKKAVIFAIPETTDSKIIDLKGLSWNCITKDGKQIVVDVNFVRPRLAIIKTSDNVEIKVRIVPYYSWRRNVLDRVR